MSNERWHADGGTVRDENGLAVACVVGQDKDNSDAVLMSAAPQMLAKLQEIAGECAGCGSYGCAECADIRAVIAMATGE